MTAAHVFQFMTLGEMVIIVLLIAVLVRQRRAFRAIQRTQEKDG